MTQYTTLARSAFSESPIERVAQTDTVGSSSLQGVTELYIWSGSINNQPTSPQYTLRKFPLKNQPNFATESVKIENTYKFDVSPIVDSYMTSSLIDIGTEVDVNNKNGVWVVLNQYESWKSGSTTVTGSKDQTLPLVALSGYWKWGEAQYGSVTESISLNSQTLPLYPWLTTQPTSISDIQPWYDLTKNIYFSFYAYAAALQLQPIDNILLVGNVGGSASLPVNTADAWVSSSLFTYEFQLDNSTIQAFYGAGNTTIAIAARRGTTQIGEALLYKFECEKKYTPVSIFWRNRYGRFDQWQFNLVSRESLNVERKTYERNAGNEYTLGYDESVGITSYNLQGHKNLVVNTDYVNEGFNRMFEDMMLSPEIYLQIDPTDTSTKIYQYLNCNVRPLTLLNNSLALKKGEVDKLIQYTFTFKYGNPYKLTY